MKLITLGVVLILVNLCTSLKLPSNFKKCDKRSNDFDDCLSLAIQSAIKLLKEPIPEYGLPSLEPLILPQNIEIGNSKGGLKQTYSNIKIKDLTKVSNVKARMDFESRTLHLEAFFNKVPIEADVHIVGNIMILPVNSSGTLVGTYNKPVYRFAFNLDKYEKNNNHYYKVLKTDLDLEMENLKFNYKNIFQSEGLNDAFNAELNANWRKIFNYLWNKYSGLFAQLFGGLFNNLLEKVPISDMFDGVKA